MIRVIIEVLPATAAHARRCAEIEIVNVSESSARWATYHVRTQHAGSSLRVTLHDIDRDATAPGQLVERALAALRAKYGDAAVMLQ